MPTQEHFQHAPCGARFGVVLRAKFPRFDLDRLKLRELVLAIGSVRYDFLSSAAEYARHGFPDKHRVHASPRLSLPAGFGMQGAHGTNLHGCLLLESSVR